MTTESIAVVAALGASLLTGLASLGVTAVRAWLHDRAERRRAKSDAVVSLLASSQLFAHRVEIIGQTIIQRSGLVEGFDILLHHRQPLDLMHFWDWLAQDFRPMADAVSRLWVLGERDLVRAANDLVLQCSSTMRTWSDIRQPGGPGGRLRQAQWPPEAQERWRSDLRELGRLRNSLAVEARRRLRSDAFEPWLQHSGPPAGPVPAAQSELQDEPKVERTHANS
ncbi:MAG TPA: hypothetical protein VMV09_00265 [Candidatus Saccharimonadales bacterium]|nr:hypothetical protein [Candidatus Saccharimonadales bacterium]